MAPRVIYLEPAAPGKPEWGQPCNGCGVCCHYDPCPVGRLLGSPAHAACRFVVWAPEHSTYRCGLLQDPTSTVAGEGWLAAWLAGIARRFPRWFARRVRRWIAAGVGCDCSLDPGP